MSRITAASLPGKATVNKDHSSSTVWKQDKSRKLRSRTRCVFAGHVISDVQIDNQRYSLKHAVCNQGCKKPRFLNKNPSFFSFFKFFCVKTGHESTTQKHMENIPYCHTRRPLLLFTEYSMNNCKHYFNWLWDWNRKATIVFITI